MNEDLLEIREHNGRGFKPLISFGEWRVAILRFLDDLRTERIDSMERYTETDEVFVLLVENDDTGDLNSEYACLSPELRGRIPEIAQREEIR